MSHTTQENQNVGMLRHWRSLLMVLGFVFLLVCILITLESMDASAEWGAPPTNGSTDGPWVLEQGDEVVRSNETLTINGDIRVEGASLTLINTTLIISDKDGGFPEFYMIQVMGPSSLNILNGSCIESLVDGQIYTGATGSILTMENSKINNTRLILNYDAFITNSELTNIPMFNSVTGIITLKENHIQMSDHGENQDVESYAPFQIYQPYRLAIENNTIINEGSVYFGNVNRGNIANNTFTHPTWSEYGLLIYQSSDITIYNNVFEFNGFMGINPYMSSHNITIRKNIFRPLDDSEGQQYGIYMASGSYDINVYENTFIDANYSITVNDSHSINIRENMIEESLCGVRIGNESHSCEVTGNVYRNVENALYEINNAPASENLNVYQNVDNHTKRANGLILLVNDKKNRPLEGCNVTISDRFDHVVFQGQTLVDGTIPWLPIINMTRTNMGTTNYAPYTVHVEKMGKSNSETFDLPEAEEVVIKLKLDIDFDVSIDVEPIFGTIKRGENVPINLTFENTGTMNFSNCQLLVRIIGGDETVLILNQTFENVDSGFFVSLSNEWFVPAITKLGTYFIQSDIICYNKYREEPYTYDESKSFQVINSPPQIDRDLLQDSNITVNKNEVMTINLTSYVSDFEDDLVNLTLSMSNTHHFKEVEISMNAKTITITPFDHFHGKVYVNFTITDLNGSRYLLPVPLIWKNHNPVFDPEINLIRYSKNQQYQMDLTDLASDEDANETLTWNYSSIDNINGNISISHNDDQLVITRTVENVTSARLSLTVFDTSDANASRIFTINWETDLFLSDLDIPKLNDYPFADNEYNIQILVHNRDSLKAHFNLFFYLDTMDSPLDQWTLEIDGQSTEQITIPWSAVGGTHEIIISLVVISPQDQNLTDHLLQLPITVYFPMTMTCDRSTNGSTIPLELVEEGNSLVVEVFTPPAKGIDHVTIMVMNLSFNGALQDLDQGSRVIGEGEGGGTELIRGIIITVTPQERNIDGASSGTFTITITINDASNCTHDDVIELCLYAEGDDGRSNYVVLHAAVKEESEKSVSQFPLFSHSTVILICGIILLPLVSVKASSALSNSFYSMYKFSHWLFLRFPSLFLFMCPFTFRTMDDDEALCNEYRNAICGILELRGGQGATLHEIMAHLKKYFPYGTTGNANPENNNVTGVVRRHIDVLKKKKFIKELGDRYYYRQYQPSLPEDIYTPKINWNSLLHNGRLKLKGQTICQVITAICNNGDNGMKNKDLCAVMDMSPCALHYHIKKLEKADIIERRKGAGKRYFPNSNFIHSYFQS